MRRTLRCEPVHVSWKASNEDARRLGSVRPGRRNRTRACKNQRQTRSHTQGWKDGSWFTFDDRRECDWIVFIFQQDRAPVRSWIIPFDIAKQHAQTPGSASKEPHVRDISWAKLNKLPLKGYEGNWILEYEPR